MELKWKTYFNYYNYLRINHTFPFSFSGSTGSAADSASGTATVRGARGGAVRQAHTGSRSRGEARSRGSSGPKAVSGHRGEDRSRGPAGSGSGGGRETGAHPGGSAGARGGAGAETVSRHPREDRARGPAVSGARGSAGTRAETVSGTGHLTRALQAARLVVARASASTILCFRCLTYP